MAIGNGDKEIMTNGIQLVDIEDVRVGRKGSRKEGGQKYAKYAEDMAEHVDWIKDQILCSKDGKIRVRKDDLSPDYKSKHSTSVYWGLKYTMFDHGIWVAQGKHRDGSDLLVMRMVTEEDELPKSLAYSKERYREMNSRSGGDDSITEIEIGT